jgi:hypothetical protein
MIKLMQGPEEINSNGGFSFVKRLCAHPGFELWEESRAGGATQRLTEGEQHAVLLTLGATAPRIIFRAGGAALSWGLC